MNRYCVIRRSDDTEVYEYGVEGGPVEWVGMEFATHDHVLLPEPVAAPPEPVHGGRRTLTRLEFLRMFSATERITIRAAAAQSAVLSDFLHMLDLADTVSLDSDDVRNAVGLIAQAGLIAPSRAVEVLRG